MNLNMDEITNYPLHWPQSQPRTPANERKRANFHTKRDDGGYGYRKHSIKESADVLQMEVKRMHGRDLVISSNMRVKDNGMPYSVQRAPDDPGVAVWFMWNKKPFCLPCDKWLTVQDNLWAIVKHLESMRGQERWGVGTLNQVFAGYAQLPDPTTRPWWEVLNVSQFADNATIKHAHINLSRQYHPDNGGDPVIFDQVQKAYDLATGKPKKTLAEYGNAKD